MIFTFVILTYKNFSDTVECIDSILSNITYKNNIVVVDNHSNDSTFSKIKDKYKNYKQIYYLETNNNLGFAKGNNVGFLFAKNNLHSDFICLLNNDTLIYQKDFIDICINDYKQHNYFVLGPSITCTVDNSEQNPHGVTIPTKFSTIKLILKNSFLLLKPYARAHNRPYLDIFYRTFHHTVRPHAARTPPHPLGSGHDFCGYTRRASRFRRVRARQQFRTFWQGRYLLHHVFG